MKEQIAGFVIAVILFILGQIFNVNNSVLAYFLQSISVLIPTFIMWKNIPKIYLKFISFKNKDIKFAYDVKVVDCDLTLDEFRNIQNALLNFNEMYKGNTKRVIQSHNSDVLFSATIEVDTTVIDLHYDREDCCLLLNTEDMISYRVFIRRIHNINEKLIKSLSKVPCGSTLCKLKVEFLSLDDDCTNPFVKKVFEGFGNKVISMTYKAKRGTRVSITNDSIEFMSDSLNCLSDDFISELTLFNIARF